MFQPPCASTDPVAAASQVVSALGDAFDDEGPHSREMTTQVLDALGTCLTYLRTCLGPAQSAAIPDSATLAAVVLALHITCTQLHAGLQPALRGIDRRQWPADQAQIPTARVAALRVALSRARDALLVAADRFADAHDAATDTTAQPNGQPGSSTPSAQRSGDTVTTTAAPDIGGPWPYRPHVDASPIGPVA